MILRSVLCLLSFQLFVRFASFAFGSQRNNTAEPIRSNDSETIHFYFCGKNRMTTLTIRIDFSLFHFVCAIIHNTLFSRLSKMTKNLLKTNGCVWWMWCCMPTGYAFLVKFGKKNRSKSHTAIVCLPVCLSVGRSTVLALVYTMCEYGNWPKWNEKGLWVYRTVAVPSTWMSHCVRNCAHCTQWVNTWTHSRTHTHTHTRIIYSCLCIIINPFLISCFASFPSLRCLGSPILFLCARLYPHTSAT